MQQREPRLLLLTPPEHQEGEIALQTYIMS